MDRCDGVMDRWTNCRAWPPGSGDTDLAARRCCDDDDDGTGCRTERQLPQIANPGQEDAD